MYPNWNLRVFFYLYLVVKYHYNNTVLNIKHFTTKIQSSEYAIKKL